MEESSDLDVFGSLWIKEWRAAILEEQSCYSLPQAGHGLGSESMNQ